MHPVLLFTYAWYRFFYTRIDNISSESLINLIQHIEKTLVKPEFINKFLTWDKFFDKYIVSVIDHTTFNFKYS